MAIYWGPQGSDLFASLSYDTLWCWDKYLALLSVHKLSGHHIVHNIVDTRLKNFKLFPFGAQWLSGRVLDSRPRGSEFEPHRRHCVVSLSKNINPSLVLVQPRKIRPFITERLLMGYRCDKYLLPLSDCRLSCRLPCIPKSCAGSFVPYRHEISAFIASARRECLKYIFADSPKHSLLAFTNGMDTPTKPPSSSHILGQWGKTFWFLFRIAKSNNRLMLFDETSHWTFTRWYRFWKQFKLFYGHFST